MMTLNGAVQKAQEAISGTANSLDGARATAQKFGVTQQTVNEIYQKYGNTIQGRALCGLLGTTPEALKADAVRYWAAGNSRFRLLRTPSRARQNSPG